MHAGTAATLALAVLAHVARGQEHEHGSASPERLGTVSFDTSCGAAAQTQMNRAVALLHSFEFGPATDAFETVARTDSSCGIAYWGVALASWGNPFAAGQKAPAQIRKGQEAVERANRAGAGSERERMYITAVAELYRDPENRDQRARVLAYRDAMAALASRHPEDMEASIFYALALAESAPPTDKTYADLLKAGAILEPLFAAHPDHPGLAHYIIHSYDVPPLAPHALDAARRYARIAPSAPHALHMPSHTFTRLGYWQESIDANTASAAAARRDGATAEELHATDYQMYAYLQTGRDAGAKRLLDSLPEIAARFDPDAVGSAAPGVAGVFALAAIPARWTLERGEWGGASRLEPRPSRFPHTEAMTWFARGLGSARVGDEAGARAAADALGTMRGRLAAAGEDYWAAQVDIEQRGVAAWLALAGGHKAEAIAGMRRAADLEDGTEKNAITPGPLAPARELLGEMLLEVNEPAQALTEFAATLRKEPGRFRALAGAARAAARTGDHAAAAGYYRQLLESCDHADDPGRGELAEGRRFVLGTTSR
jgi:tetratricopeptide (TPR) repeat protein